MTISILWGVTLSLLAFECARWIYHQTNNQPLLHPTLLGAVFVAVVLVQANISFDDYLHANDFLVFMLGPATVALAIPMFRQIELLKRLFVPLMLTCLLGASVAAVSAVFIAWMLGTEPLTLLSIAPKSVTTPIAIEISRETGAQISLTTGAVVITAITGIVLGPYIMRWLNIRDPRINGFCLGIAAHGVGVAKSFEQSAKAGAFASLALCLTGTLSAIAIPLFYYLFFA